MKKSIKKILGLALALAIILSLQASAFAVETGYTNGSIEINSVLDNTTYSNVSLALYKVGNVTDGEGDTVVYSLTGAFDTSGVQLNGLSAQETMNAASTLRNYAPAVPDASGTTGSDGKYMFTGLEMGVYLIIMTGNGGNNILMNPFLVYLPYNVAGEWYYAVKATPKISVPVPWFPDPSDPPIDIPDESGPLAPGETPTPDDPDPEPPVIEIPDPDDPLSALPQTGLLQWPIPAMAFLGIVLFCIGWTITNKKKAADEN